MKFALLINSIKISFLALLCISIIPKSAAQEKDKENAEEERVKLERADILEKKPDNPHAKKVKNNVVVRHKGSILYCDSAYLYENKNVVEAFGNCRLVGENGTTLTGKSMSYDGNTQTAKAIGKVVLIDEKMTLSTEELDYDLQGGVAYYYTRGKIINQENDLVSESGSYDTNSKIFYFKKDVELVNRNDGRKVNTDDLTYNTVSKIAYFKGPTKLSSEDGVVYTEDGTYNTETKISNFKGRTNIDNADYYLEGDSLYYDNINRIGFARGNVILRAKKDSVIINGEIGRFWGKTGISKVYGDALMRNISRGDTLFITADTLISINNKETNTKLLKAYNKTRIYKSDFQGKCDSLIYNRGDSTFYFYDDPVLWNKDNQISADSITVQMANNKIQKMTLKINSFLISEDTLKNYNQLKGKNMTAYFENNRIKKVDVFGNGQNIYFALEKDTTLIGMNRIECSDMVIQFTENNKIHKVSYINKPDAVFVPPHEIEEPQTKLKDFRWRVEERPNRLKMIKREFIADKKKK